MSFLADTLQNTTNGLHSIGINTPELGLTEAAGGANVASSYKLPGTDKMVYSNYPMSGDKQFYGAIYNFDGPEVRYVRDAAKPAANTGLPANNSQITNDGTYYSGGTSSGYTAPRYTARDEQAAYDDQISALDKLLGYTNTQREAGLTDLTNKYNAEKGTLKNQYESAINGYNEQRTVNAQCLKTDSYWRKMARSVFAAMDIQNKQCCCNLQ